METLRFLKKKCYASIAYAPKETSLRDANVLFTKFVEETDRGLVMYHDHFAGEAGGFAIFYVDTAQELKALQEPGPLQGWDLKFHPLTFSENPVEFLYQIDFTMAAYRGRRLKELANQYESSEFVKHLDQQLEAK